MAGPPLPSIFTITLVRLDGPIIWLEAEGSAERGDCPRCGASSSRLHDRYVRRPFDLPWRGRVVRLRLMVRRFRCGTPTCPRQTFAEDFGPALARFARRTADAAAVLLRFAVATGGEAGARLAHAIGLPVSAATLLRLLQPTGSPGGYTPRVLGVDDLALRRRHRYATLFVDLETRRPIDLVPERDVETLATWLRAHPGVEIIVRDRAEAYAEGASQGAPDAIQIADRFHLVPNAGAALEELLRGRSQQVTVPPMSVGPAPEAALTGESSPIAPPMDPPAPGSAAERQRAERRAARLARGEDIRTRRAAGQPISQIARDMGKERKPIRRYLARPAPPPSPYVVHPRPSGLRSPTLQPYRSYLQDRWQAGCMNVSQLFRALVAQG